MEREKMELCLDFAEGKKGKFTILMAKKPNFPETLIEGTEKQQEIMQYVDDGLTTRQIASLMGCSSPTIVEHIGQYRRGVAFHKDWCEFWDYISDIREMPISEAFDGIVKEETILSFQKNGVYSVGDFLLMFVTMSKKDIYNKNQKCLNATECGIMFERLKEICFSIAPCEFEYK